MVMVLPSGGSFLGRILFFLGIPSFWLNDVIMTSPALLTDAVLVIRIASNSSGGSFSWTKGSITCVLDGFSNFNYFPSATQPNCLFSVRITILVTAFLTFLTRLLQRFLKLLNFIGELPKILVYRITFLSAFFSSAEIRFLLSVLFKPTTIMSVVSGIRTPMLLAQVAVLLKLDFLRNPGRRISTRALLPFLALVGRLLRRFQFTLLVGADAFDCFQQSQKQAHVHWHHALLVHVILGATEEGTYAVHEPLAHPP
jgi:hypothetical protein